jgi:hypothetical protein
LGSYPVGFAIKFRIGKEMDLNIHAMLAMRNMVEKVIKADVFPFAHKCSLSID